MQAHICGGMSSKFQSMHGDGQLLSTSLLTAQGIPPIAIYRVSFPHKCHQFGLHESALITPYH